MAHRVLIVADVEGWAYWKRACALKKYAPEDFEVTVRCDVNKPPEHELWKYDLVYLLDYALANIWKNAMKRAAGDVPFVVSYNKDRGSRTRQFRATMKHADFVVINNHDAYQFALSQGHRNVCNISNGVDTDVYRLITPIKDRALKAVWSGSTGTVKMKNYTNVLLPLVEAAKEIGVECEFRGIDEIDERVWSAEQMVQSYNSASFVINAANSEGTPNGILEGMACGCVPVTTYVANVKEFAKDGVNCVLCQPHVESFMNGLRMAIAWREEISRQAHNTIQRWSYKFRSAYFFALFRNLIAGEKVKPFSYLRFE